MLVSYVVVLHVFVLHIIVHHAVVYLRNKTPMPKKCNM